MIELTNNAVQIVDDGLPVLYNQETTHSGCCEYHRIGSGRITLLKPGRYLVSFSANVAVPAGQTPGELVFAIAEDAERVYETTMIVTPTAEGAYFNIAAHTYIDVIQRCGHTCCVNVSVLNLSTIPASVANPNLTAVRVNG